MKNQKKKILKRVLLSTAFIGLGAAYCYEKTRADKLEGENRCLKECLKSTRKGESIANYALGKEVASRELEEERW